MSLPLYSSHTGPLSLWQSAMHEVLSQKPELQDSPHCGLGMTAMAPEMQATAQVVKQFDRHGNFDVAASAAAGALGDATQGAGTDAQPPSVRMQCAKLAAQIALYSATDPAKAEMLRQE